MSDPFMLKEDEYERDLDVISTYQRDAAFFLSRMTNRPMEECLSFVQKETGAGGQLPLRDPMALVLTKDKPGTRTQITMPFSRYLLDAQEKETLLSPSMATYVNPRVKESLLAKYINVNMGLRNKAKDEMFVAQRTGDSQVELLKFIEQTSMKIKNNSLSGAHASPYTILYNKSAHSTLTSTCRSAAGYGNANNEKFLAGNRHYWSPDVVKANIVSIVQMVDYGLIDEAMFEYGIRAPTVEETMECISYSTDLYWRNSRHMESIQDLVERLTPLERSAFVYVGDLYHLAKYNDSMVRIFLDRLSSPATEPIDDPDEYIGQLRGEGEILVKYLHAEEIKNRSFSKLKEEDPAVYALVGATAKQHFLALKSYSLFIRAFITTKVVPASMASLPSIIRRATVASDTDSTIFTTQYWTTWFVGKTDFSKKSCAIRDVMGFLTSKMIAHILKIATAQMGVVPEHRGRLSMKNEYTFPVFSLTSRAKHYYAYRSAQEGNVFGLPELEIKGVALRSSNTPPRIAAKANALIERVMGTVIAGEKLKARDVLREIAAIEIEIRDSVLAGKYDYFKSGSIKPASSYRNPESSPFIHYLMWEEVFAPKYGHTEAPTYSCIKVSIDAPNPTALASWLSGIEDRDLAERLETWLRKAGRRDLTTLQLPEAVVANVGVPKEVVAAVDIRKLILDIMEPFYLILESLGLYMKDDNITKLVSDYYGE